MIDDRLSHPILLPHSYHSCINRMNHRSAIAKSIWPSRSTRCPPTPFRPETPSRERSPDRLGSGLSAGMSAGASTQMKAFPSTHQGIGLLQYYHPSRSTNTSTLSSFSIAAKLLGVLGNTAKLESALTSDVTLHVDGAMWFLSLYSGSLFRGRFCCP